MEENEVKEVKTQDAELKFNGVAIASFVCAMVGIFYLRFPCAVAAIITGIIALVKFDSSKEKGKWMAITGLSVGGAILAIYLFFIFFGSALLFGLLY